MNESYLLHNETAKKLYFEYAKDLPIIALCDKCDTIEGIYHNITEAFLNNDLYKLDAMRKCGVDEKLITGDASDYEKFKAFCSVLPKFAGHPLYLLSHIELKHNFNCELSICEDNCDMIWLQCNESFETTTLKANNIELIKFIDIDNITDEFLLRKKLNSFEEYENAILSEILKANENDCKNAIISLFGNLVKPNPYTVGEIFKTYLCDYESLTYKEFRMLDIQTTRSVGILCKELSWNWLYRLYEPSPELLEYLDKSNALPSGKRIYQYGMQDTESEFENEISKLAKETCLGNLTCTVDITSVPSIYARNDYFRRIVCNIIGKWVENGEYTSDERALQKLIEDILYNNLKEAIS